VATIVADVNGKATITSVASIAADATATTETIATTESTVTTETMTNEFTTNEEISNLISKEAAVIIYFYSDNCAPCLSLRPKVQKLVDDSYPEVKLAFVNSEKYPALPAKYSIFSNPTILLFFDGREYRRESKYISISQLSEAIERPYNMIFE
jgi:thioredoxin-like negative regulator of GroEL